MFQFKILNVRIWTQRFFRRARASAAFLVLVVDETRHVVQLFLVHGA